MKTAIYSLTVAASVSPVVATQAVREQAVAPQTPISRVVALLEGLSTQTVQDGKKEKELYESFVCWAKSVVDQKTSTNAAANARIAELQTYIQDIDAGKIEFSTERVDLTKELAAIKADIQAAESLRDKEHNEFLSADDEMTKAIAALDDAIQVLGDATKDNTGSVLFAQVQDQARVTEGFAARTHDARNLDHAVELGERVLSKGDALFLRRLLTGDVPTHDWNKLNRKATFKKDYKTRSGEIQDVLKNMQKTFTASLADATAKEADAKTLHDSLMNTKRAQESATSEALNKMEVEMGMRGEAKEESQAEVDALTQQVENDVKFIQQTQTGLAEKKEEWKDRQELRAAELEAFAKAIAILHNDDARNLMKRSFASQGYLFLQESRSSVQLQRSAGQLLQEAARKAGDARLATLASRLTMVTKSHFTEVVQAIDTMVATLKSEENSDLTKKEACEKNRADDTRDAVLKARAIDDSTDLIAKLTSEIAEINVEIKDKEDTIAHIQEELQEATRNRQDENTEWVQSNQDDTDAASTVKSARDVLANYYSDNNLMLLQHRKAPVVVAGSAPPPPPTTWDAPYGGKTEQSKGIIAILEMLGEDIKEDQKKAKAAEDEAQAAFNTFKGECDAQVLGLNTDISALQGTRSEKETSVTQEESTRGNTRGELAARMKLIRDAEPGCDYVTITYPMRLKNRHIEIDGLRKAKAILEGAAFDAPDPNREIKPGDAAFLQRK